MTCSDYVKTLSFNISLINVSQNVILTLGLLITAERGNGIFLFTEVKIKNFIHTRLLPKVKKRQDFRLTFYQNKSF